MIKAHNAFSLNSNRIVTLMVWPTNPKLRKNTFEIQVNSKKELKIGEEICVSADGPPENFTPIRTYLIKKIIDFNPAKLKGLTNYKLTVKEKRYSPTGLTI